MLTLAGKVRSIGQDGTVTIEDRPLSGTRIRGYTVFADDETPLRYWVLPDKELPRVARGPDGTPMFSLVVYRKDEDRIDPASKDDVGGGLLHITLDLSVPDEDLNAIRSEVTGRVLADSDVEGATVEVGVVPFIKGKVRVAVAGEAAGGTGVVEGGEFVRSIIGDGDVSTLGAVRKGIAAKLTQAGAALLLGMQGSSTLPLFVELDLSFEHRLDGVTVVVWCRIESHIDLKKTLATHAESYQEDGYFDDDTKFRDVNHAATVTQTLTRSRMMGVMVTPGSSEVDQDSLATLEKFGMDLLTKEVDRCIEATPLPPERTFDAYLTSFESAATNSLNFSLVRQLVLLRSYIASGALSGISKEEIKAGTDFVDLRSSAFAMLRIPVRVNADFERFPIKTVAVTIHFNRRPLEGGPMESVAKTFVFTAGGEIYTFAAFANSLAELSYTWEAEVTYAGEQGTMRIKRSNVTDRALVVNVGDLGLLDVSVNLGLVDPEDFPEAVVGLRYDSTELGKRVETRLKLSDAHPSGRWVDLVRESPDHPYEYKVDWRTKSGAILEGSWLPSQSDTLYLDMPRRDRLSISVVASGDFTTQLSQVVVALSYQDAANDYTVDDTLTFTKDGMTLPWSVDLIDREIRSYSYRYSLVYRDGVTRNIPADGSMLPGRPGFIAVGELYDLKVTIDPILLTFDEHTRIVEVRFTAPDAVSPSRRSATLVFRKKDEPVASWGVDLIEGATPAYDVQVVYHSTTGHTTVDLGTRTETYLVVPAAPPPPLPPPAPVSPP